MALLKPYRCVRGPLNGETVMLDASRTTAYFEALASDSLHVYEVFTPDIGPPVLEWHGLVPRSQVSKDVVIWRRQSDAGDKVC